MKQALFLPFTLIYPDIFFNIQPVNAGAFNFFYAALYKRIFFNGNSEVKLIAFPLPVAAIFQVFGISAILKCVRATTR